MEFIKTLLVMLRLHDEPEAHEVPVMADESVAEDEEEFDSNCECCDNCRFFLEYSNKDPNDKDEPDGCCQRRSPQIIPAPATHHRHTLTFFPEVNKDDWCGEFEEEDDDDGKQDDSSPPDEKLGKLNWSKPSPKDLSWG